MSAAPKAVPRAVPKSPARALREDKTCDLADMFKMLGAPSRLRIVISTLEGPISVGEIAGRLGLSISLVSHHLRLLRAARLVTADRRGKQIFYMIHDQHVAHVISDMVAHVTQDTELRWRHPLRSLPTLPLWEGRNLRSEFRGGVATRATKSSAPIVFETSSATPPQTACSGLPLPQGEGGRKTR